MIDEDMNKTINSNRISGAYQRVDLQEVSFSYTGVDLVLEKIQLGVDMQETVAVVGPSGCGKSTLLRLIAGVLKPTSGRVLINGGEVKGPVPSVGFVPQDALLFPWRTVLENVRLPLELQGNDGKSAAEKARAALGMTNLYGVEGLYPHQLSGGMKQRVAIARALVRPTELLLLDEPFSSLDTLTRSDLHGELMRIKEQTRVAIVLVTHNLFEAILLADRVVVLGERPGRIIDQVEIDLSYPRNPQSEVFQKKITLITEALVKGGIAGGI